MSSREKQAAVKLGKYLHFTHKSGLILSHCALSLSLSLSCPLPHWQSHSPERLSFDFDRDIKVEALPSLTLNCHTSHLNQIFIKS